MFRTSFPADATAAAVAPVKAARNASAAVAEAAARFAFLDGARR